MANVPKLSWTQVAVVLGTFAVVGLLAWLKIELTAFLSFAALVLVGVGVMQANTTKEAVTEVKQQTNGNNQKLVAAAMIALAYTPASDADRILALLSDAGVLSNPSTPALPSAVVPSQREPLDVESSPAP